MAVLSPAQLRGLKSHKYKAQGISITEIFVQPFWNWLVTLIPMWVAPNLITFTGLLVNIITCIAVMLTDLNMTGQVYNNNNIHVYYIHLVAIVAVLFDCNWYFRVPDTGWSRWQAG